MATTKQSKSKSPPTRIILLTNRLQTLRLVQELSPDDFCPFSDDALRKSDAEGERIARLADEHGLDGSIFRDMIAVENPFSQEASLNRYRQIDTIPRIIAAIEKAIHRGSIPEGAELLSVPQVARLLGWGESMVRERDKKGLLPMPSRIGGSLQWSKRELLEWIDVHCPTRQEWELSKLRKGACVNTPFLEQS